MSSIRCNYSFIPHKHGHNRQQLYYDGLFDEFFNSLMVDCSPPYILLEADKANKFFASTPSNFILWNLCTYIQSDMLKSKLYIHIGRSTCVTLSSTLFILALILPFRTYSRPDCSARATSSVMPGTDCRASRLALRIPSMLPKRVSRALRRCGPMPGMASKREATPSLPRALR